jgi:hypothetical protein
MTGGADSFTQAREHHMAEFLKFTIGNTQHWINLSEVCFVRVVRKDETALDMVQFTYAGGQVEAFGEKSGAKEALKALEDHANAKP